MVEGPMAALDDRPHPGKEPTITIQAKAWLTSLACWKAKELGYPQIPATDDRGRAEGADWQFRNRETGPVATFDLFLLAGDTKHPYWVQCGGS